MFIICEYKDVAIPFYKGSKEQKSSCDLALNITQPLYLLKKLPAIAESRHLMLTSHFIF